MAKIIDMLTRKEILESEIQTVFRAWSEFREKNLGVNACAIYQKDGETDVWFLSDTDYMLANLINASFHALKKSGYIADK